MVTLKGLAEQAVSVADADKRDRIVKEINLVAASLNDTAAKFRR